ncbi:MAG: integrase core domain-containing protein [Planctomycetaceae bacterium]|nr:integrase core domain-containing protein [Planctomycetaceae bacterium]
MGTAQNTCPADEVWTRSGLITFYVLVAMRLKSREIVVAGVTASPDAPWVRQMARNLTDDEGFLAGTTHLILDRDTKFVPLRRYLDEHTAVKPVVLPPRSPDLNAHLERQFRSMKFECLDRLIFFGERSLWRALTHWQAHYHAERNHQGLSNQLIAPQDPGGVQQARSIAANDWAACCGTLTDVPPDARCCLMIDE